MKRSSVGIIVTLVAGYIFAMPYITVYQMKIAAENHDGEALSEHIDFPLLRQHLKDQLNVQLAAEMEMDDNPFTAIVVTFGGMLVGKVIDTYVTPAGIMELMKGESPNTENTGSSIEKDTYLQPFANVSMSYASLSKFSVTVKQTESDEDVKFVLRRKGIRWKLTEILLPLEAIYSQLE